MGDPNPLDALAAQLREVVHTLHRAALHLPNTPNVELGEISDRAGRDLAAIRAGIAKALVTLPDGRILLAIEHAALMTFARANGIDPVRLWEGVTEISDRGRIRWAEFVWCDIADLSALARCTEIRNLALIDDKIVDISALAGCGALERLLLNENRITDISALAHCQRLEMLDLTKNRVTDLSPLSHCTELAFLFLADNGFADISALANCGQLDELYLSGNQITDISPLSSCVTLRDLNLRDNQITDISALESCTQLCMVELMGNPLSRKSLRVIEKLRARGVCVYD